MDCRYNYLTGNNLVRTTQMACLRQTCDGDDLFVFAIMSVGMLVPAGLVAFLVSEMLKNNYSILL